MTQIGILALALLSVLTAQSVTIPSDALAQPITAATPFEQLAQGGKQQSQQQEMQGQQQPQQTY